MFCNKKILAIWLVVMCSACSDSYTERHFPIKPKELEDCKIYLLTNSGGSHITVVRCPNSTTSTSHDKNQTTVVIDGEIYVKEKK